MTNEFSSLRLGIDVGSTTVKVVVMEPQSKKVLFSRYKRHNAYQAETVHALLTEVISLFPGVEFKAAVCGSGGKPIAEALHAHYIQEVVANAVAVRTFYPQARVAVELGGQDAKVVFFYYDEGVKRLVASDMRMNGSCAGGTGAFIDEVASLLRVPVEEFEALASRGTAVYDISGRCGVFAKTDIQPLLNQGGLPEDIALSAFHAIVKQTIGGLAQGLELKPPIIFEGGPLTFNPTLIRVFAERLGLKPADIIRPENPETLIAYGTALSLDEMFADSPLVFHVEKALMALVHFRERISAEVPVKKSQYFASPGERMVFEERHKLPPPPRADFKKGDKLRVYLGIDAGSTTSKFVLLDEHENVVDSFYSNNQGEPLRVIKKALVDLKKRYDDMGVALEIIALGTTGYGELLFDKAFGADYHTVETVAHAEAAQKYMDRVSFILDIGGQDMKAITIADGIVTNITLNEACSSGCGSFLETFASNLNIPVNKIADAAFNAKNPAELGSRCTVFMNSTIITEQKNGKQADDIMAGLCRSIIENVFTKVIRISNFSGLGDKIVVQGGTFKNNAVLRALEQYLEKPVIRAPYPGEMGAIGIALLTKKHITENGFTSPHGTAGRTRFIGLEAMAGFDYTQQTNVKCNFCTNNCNRTLVTFSYGNSAGPASGEAQATTWITGNRCERGEVIGSMDDSVIRERIKQINTRMDEVPDMIKFREKLLFRDYPFTLACPERNITIGLPRALDFWRTMPFFTVFFRALGFNIKVSNPSSKKLFEKGLQSVASDTVCFPAKLVHGHIHDLIESKVDRIFLPLFSHLPPDNPEPLSTYTCPVLKGYPLVVKYSDDPQRNWNIPLDSPVFHWFKQADRDHQLCRYMQKTYGIPREIVLKAIAQGDEALETFNTELVAEGARIIEEVEREGKFAVVITGRHYQFDELVNHQLSRYFTNWGIPVITVDALSGLKEVDLSRTMLDINNSNHARLLSGAILTARHPALEYVQIFSFGCGHDAIYTDEVTRLMKEISGKAPLILKLDESEVAGPLRIRVRSFIETVQARRERETGRMEVKPLRDPYPVKFTKKNKDKIFLIPNVSRAFCKVMSAAIGKQGFKVAPLPMGGKEAIQLGKKYVHNDSCFPAQMLIGEALAVLKSGEYNPDEVVVGTGKTYCDCRLVNYMVLTRKALDDAGYPQVPIYSTDIHDLKNIHPGFKLSELSFARAGWTLVMVEILENLRRKIRPYEFEKGETDRVFEISVDRITEALYRGGMLSALWAYRKAIKAIRAIRYDRTVRKPLVFITGEYLLTYHAGSNYYIEDYLEKNDMEVELPRMNDIYRNLMLMHIISKFKDYQVIYSKFEMLRAFAGDKFFDIAQRIMELSARKHPLYEPALQLPELAKYSDPFIDRSICSGESFLMAADILHRASEGVKSFILLQPFGCLPNHFAGRGIVKRIKEEYPGIQILALDYDPDTSFANIENRLQMLIMNTRIA
ncbi:CoA enzyme activase [Treponema primitia ZAS-2]|uniref:CoA enzyme activase n=1 Tax=Treponema primitia (strain ATCC BAA-887 / DSM 12427 / ZAS-2) TaxID=545694 RepID=F5YQI9_TREPZ|nr:acyl-CoA dehydratase activase [Treponema primitia]AEF86263.1 CoA enzyme activase [Treponema primitia ZAS-2]